MKKPTSLTLAILLLVTLCTPVAAAEAEPAFVPEEYTQEELLAMDEELDSDGDGLVDVIELVYKMNRFDPDTDGDGVTDYTEFCVTCTDPLTPDGEIDTDGDGLTNAQEGIYGTNPDDLDTDNDTYGDYAEIMELHTDPLVKDYVPEDALTPTTAVIQSLPNGTAIEPAAEIVGPGTSGTAYSGTLHTKYSGTSYTSSVSYVMNYDYFFGSNTLYRPELAKVSSLLSAIAYDNNKLTITGGGTMNSEEETAVWDWMDFHGFSHPTNSYDLHDDYSDQHVSEMFVGHRSVTYYGTTKNIICIVIRGTNGTLEEWQSNFDVGGGSVTHSEWTAKLNHMGFDVTVNRLSDKLSGYMKKNGLTKDNSVLWFTGHSRGGALANLLAAKRVNAGYEVFGYTFASPGTTTSTNTTAAKYCCIFNIINEDDFVPMLPMENWGFARYGVDKDEISIEEDGLADDWDALTGGNYTFTETAQTNALNRLKELATTRDTCYSYFSTSDVIICPDTYLTSNLADGAARQFVKQYPTITATHYRYTVYGSAISYIYQVEYQPAFFMKMLAYAMSGNGPTFIDVDMPTRFNTARNAICAYDFFGEIKEPHYCESYYLLATKLS